MDPENRVNELVPDPRVMAGLVPAIHAFLAARTDVDARHKAGHDVVSVNRNLP
jgi:hypothetical protein